MLNWIKHKLSASLLFCVLAVTGFSIVASVIFAGFGMWLTSGPVFSEELALWLPITMLVPALVAPFPTVVQFRLNRALIQAREQLHLLAITDALTGAHNRRHLMDEGSALLAQSGAEKPLSAVLIDIDHFKSFNDRWGHAFGDQVLKEVATCLRDAIPEQALFARYGGEEFAVILPTTQHAQAMAWAEKARSAVAVILPVASDGDQVGVFISLGVVSSQSEKSLDIMLDQADQCLYVAKRSGRNRVVGQDELSDFSSQAQQEIPRAPPLPAELPTGATAELH